MLYVQAASTAAKSLSNIDRKGGAMRRLIILVAAFSAVATIYAGLASASTKVSQLNYCGPAFTSKAAMIDWLQTHPVQRNKAEAYVRKHAGYYHIRADQSFIAWLTMPNIKFKRAPYGYVLRSNTGCDSYSNVVGYSGKLGVSNLPMLWWCSNPKGSGYNCTPIAKYYCRNWVTGHMVFRAIPKAAKPKKPVIHKKKRAPAVVSYNCTKLATLNRAGQDVVLQVVTVQKGATFVGTTWNMTPTKVFDKKTAQFHVTQTGLVTIVAKAEWKIGSKRVVSKNCLTVLSFQPTTTTPAQCTGTLVNGVCTATTSVVCTGNQTTIYDSNGVAIACQNQTQTQTQGNNGNCVGANACSSGGSSTPSAPSATVINLTNLQDQGGVAAGNTYTICWDAGTSESMSVVFGADHGSGAGGPWTVNGNGTQHICASYTAPNDAQPTTDTYRVTVLDNGKQIAEAHVTVNVQPQSTTRGG